MFFDFLNQASHPNKEDNGNIVAKHIHTKHINIFPWLCLEIP
jgi:hypothetical protein